jgi:sugar phosphate permease
MRAFKATQRILLLICVMYLIIYIDRSNIGTAATAMRKDLALSNVELGLIFSAFGYPYAALVLFGGYFADRFGARSTFFVCTVVFSVATILTGLATGIVTLMLARAMLGLGEAPALSTATRAMTNWLPQQRWGFGQGITHAAARIGTALTPPLVAALIESISWRGSFVVAGFASLAVAFIWLISFRDNPADHPHITREELAELRAVEPRREKIPVGALAKRFLPLVITFFCYGWTLWVYLNWLPSFFGQNFHLDLKNSAVFSAGILLGGVAGDILGGLLSDYIYKRTGKLTLARTRLIQVSFVLAFSCLTVVLFSSNLMLVSIALTVTFFLAELAVAPLWLITMDVAPKYSGTAGGFLSVGFAAAAILSPIAFGAVVDSTQNWQLPFSFSMALLLVGAISAIWLRPDRPFVEPGEEADNLVNAAG